MRKYLKDKNILKKCHIYQMLERASTRPHLSFHTPGHKIGKWDVTELSFSDNLSCPRGCIAQAEQDIAEILGSEKSFILTDGSSSGVLSMLHAARAMGVKHVAFCEASHKSVYNGCALLGLTPLLYPLKKEENPANAYTAQELLQEYATLFKEADALFLTSPDYYGNVADWSAIREYCDEEGKLLLVDGAHGTHLHYNRALYAGEYADIWVDGVHKNLPCFTQGAVVSARTSVLAEKLREALDIFRTTSPSYPIMASVEYAVKYPRNIALEEMAIAFEKETPRIYFGGDWTKLCVSFGEHAYDVEKELENKGIFAEFCDGNVVMFYLSPATAKREFLRLKKELTVLIQKYPLSDKKTIGNSVQRIPAPLVLTKNKETEWVEIEKAEGRICANNCGLFPPCTPLIKAGEAVKKEKIELLQKADNVYGLCDGKIQVLKEKEEA